jgi:thioredoxin-like negative regulator of GroEL
MIMRRRWRLLTVTVKVKHLIIGILVLCLAIPFYLYSLSPRLQLYWAEKHYTQGTLGGKEELLQAIAQAPGKRRLELIRTWIIGNGYDSTPYGYDVYVGPGSYTNRASSDGGMKAAFTPQEMLPYLEEYLQAADTDIYLAEAAMQASHYYRITGQSDKGLSVLSLGEARLGAAEQAQALKLKRAELLVELDRTQEAEAVLKKLTEALQPGDIEPNGNIVRLRAQILMNSGNFRNSLEHLNKELETAEAVWNKEKPPGSSESGVEPWVLVQLKELRDQLQRTIRANGDEAGASTVSGIVKKSDGSPLVGAAVFLRDKGSVNHSIVNGEPYQTVTDAQGHYKFKGVIPDSYQLYLGLRLEQIDGWTWPVQYEDWIDIRGGEARTEDITLAPLIKLQSPVNETVITGNTIRFQWEPVPGAAYYELKGSIQTGNSWITANVKSRIEDSWVELPLEALYDSASGYTYDTVDGQMTADPVSLLGFAYPEARFAWGIQAYDKDGNMLTRSDGYRLNASDMESLPFYYIQERQLTEGDRLLLEGRRAEASAAYQAALDRQPADTHSLRMLIRLDETEAAGTGEVNHMDMAQESERIARLERMEKLDGTGKYSFKLANHYYEQEDWESYEAAFNRYKSETKEPLSAYDLTRHAAALLKQQKPAEALREYEQSLPGDPSHRFVGHYLAAALLGNGSLESVLELAVKYPERSYAYTGRDWTHLVKELQNEAAVSGNGYQEELIAKLEWLYSGRIAELEQWRSTSEQAAMKAFLGALEDLK